MRAKIHPGEDAPEFPSLMSDHGPFRPVTGGITAPIGFLAGAIHCGIKTGNLKKADLALLCSATPSVGAAVFTTNKIKAAPVKVSMAHLKTADLRAVVLNSGNANACTGSVGIDHAKRMTAAAGWALGLRERQILVCSTGRIGMALPIERIEQGIAALAPALNRAGSKAAARAIMTSDTFPKEISVEVELAGERRLRLGGMAKGAGMIDPNMATMLCVLTTDAPVEKKELQRALGTAVEQSFNRITVDGDMSTNDTVIALANGQAGGPRLVPSSDDFERFQGALNHVTRNLARMIVEDGEGVTRFVEVHVSGAQTFADARSAAEAVANSALVKCAWYGGDPNWGRLMDAVGYSDAAVREEMIDIYYNGLLAVKAGVASNTPADKLQEIVRQKKFTVHIHLGMGSAEYVVYTSDLTPEYVRLNKGE